MVESLQSSAQLTSVLEIDASPLVTARERLNAEGASPRVSYTTLFVSLLATALLRHPLLNSRVAGDEIELLADVNIGVAVDTPDGLIVPVVHRADTLSIHEVNARIGELVDRARAGTLALADVESGTFTLSNAGIHPVDITTAILNPPQSALLWVGRIRERPIVIDGGLHIRPTVQACLTFDHRAIDGAPAAEFLGTVEELVRELAAER
jgi:pyruvate dehydrogenase E2 component (dihydrolipoamide acetyltransferase)